MDCNQASAEHNVGVAWIYNVVVAYLVEGGLWTTGGGC